MPTEGSKQFESSKEELGIAPTESIQGPQTGIEDSKTGKLIDPEKLRYITKSLELLRPETNPLAEETHWKELYKEVKPWQTGLELSDNVRETVRGFVEQKIPKLKERVPTLENLDDAKLLDALTHNWFEGIDEKISGQRREVLLTVMAHVVKRIETTSYRNILQEAAPADLEKLGLDEGLKDLLINILEASIKADPLFVRFLAYTQLSPEPPPDASGVALYTPNSSELNTIAVLFPHETQFLS
ncbi:MAG: hypothetical protein HY454_04090, partial [Parcubacteria group bacterium]|nr:hypothetical protein [Parcubacteria group bacterium]